MARLRAFDRDEKGFINGEDLKKVTLELGEELSDEDVGDIIQGVRGNASADNLSFEVSRKLEKPQLEAACNGGRACP